MHFVDRFDKAVNHLTRSANGIQPLMERIRSEIDFANRLADLYPAEKDYWHKLIAQVVALLQEKLPVINVNDLPAIVSEAEEILSPIGKVAKEYTIHCCGHAHIDMNWMWPWDETVSVCHDTFSTVDRLMDEFPAFLFSQSQASTYASMEQHCPEIFEMIKRRVDEGRWEPTASMWVEGDKNLAAGEILCRHILYTRQYLREKLGVPYDTVKIAWEPDTFGHAHTLPSILARGGVTRYYHARTGPSRWLLWWQSPDGSRVLRFNDKATYSGSIDAYQLTRHLLDYIEENGLKDYMFVYGVGDHGGGPTRRDLMRALDIDSWPIYPNVKLSTVDAYFSAVEKVNPDLPVHDGELNFVFPGCYTSQSNIKRANRVSENILPEVEAISVVAGAIGGFTYPADDIRRGWQLAMFNQFHDILPGSGVKATYEHAQGLFQEVRTIARSVRTRALRRLADQIDTCAASGLEAPSGNCGASLGDSLGAGAGDPSIPGDVSACGAGAVSAEPVMVFNQLAFPRSAMVEAKVWNKEFPAHQVIVRDEDGNVTAGQVLETGYYWGHNFTRILFPAADVPAMGYRVYTLDVAPDPVIDLPSDVIPGWQGINFILPDCKPIPLADEVKCPSPGTMENSLVRVEVDLPSGAVKHLIDKSTGYDFVPAGGLMGMMEYCQESPHVMSAWEIGHFEKIIPLTGSGRYINASSGDEFRIRKPSDEGVIANSLKQCGPHRAVTQVGHRIGSSRIVIEVSVVAGSSAVGFKVTADWREMGGEDSGVPMLRMAFLLNAAETTATYEIPFGSTNRPVDGTEVPALRWADLSGKRIGRDGTCGITMVNADKYGHSADKNALRLTLLRSSYEPDPLPEIGLHEIELSIMPHDGDWSVSESAKAGAAFNIPMSVVSTDVHKGELPASKSFVEVLSPNVMLSALKKAEDSSAVVVRLWEMEGRDTEARVRISDIVKPGSPAVEVDLMEQPISNSSARMEGDVLVVRIPAHGISSIALGR